MKPKKNAKNAWQIRADPTELKNQRHWMALSQETEWEEVWLGKLWALVNLQWMLIAKVFPWDGDGKSGKWSEVSQLYPVKVSTGWIFKQHNEMDVFTSMLLRTYLKKKFREGTAYDWNRYFIIYSAKRQVQFGSMWRNWVDLEKLLILKMSWARWMSKLMEGNRMSFSPKKKQDYIILEWRCRGIVRQWWRLTGGDQKLVEDIRDVINVSSKGLDQDRKNTMKIGINNLNGVRAG